MDIEFDPVKDASNIAKHGISLTRVKDLDVRAVVEDVRFTEEIRFRAYGVIDGSDYCLAYTLRGRVIRPISLRRAHDKETKRHANP